MALATLLEFAKGAGTAVGGTILVYGSLIAVAYLYYAIEGPRRRRKSLGPSDFGRIRGRMMRGVRPTLLLTPANEPGFSKLGGDPELPSGTQWPAVGQYPRTFVAQIDLAAFRAHGGPEWLPQKGRFYAFVSEARYGFADLVQLVFSEGPSGPPTRAAPPAKAFPERRVAFEAYTSTPSLEWLGVDLTEVNLTDEELDELANMPDAPFGDEIQHRIGGYPSEIQDEQMAISCELMRRGLPGHGETEITPAIERASKQWRLLLQIDSDPALKMNWGDGGRLYVFIREKDAVAGDFSRTVTLSQTY